MTLGAAPPIAIAAVLCQAAGQRVKQNKAPRECAGLARQPSKLQDEVRFLGEVVMQMRPPRHDMRDCGVKLSSECDGFARDSAKVEGQVRLLARTLAFNSVKCRRLSHEHNLRDRGDHS